MALFYILISILLYAFVIFQLVEQASTKCYFFKINVISICSFLSNAIINSLQPHLRNVIEYMLQVNKDTDEEVALEACEFWYYMYLDVIFLMVQLVAGVHHVASRCFNHHQNNKLI